MPRQYGPKGWSARKEGKDFASNFLHDLQGVTTEVTWGDELWDRLGEAPHADQVWSYVFPMLLSVAVRRPEDMGFGAGYSVATLCEVLSHIFGAAIERVVLPPPQYHPMRSAHEGAAAAPVEAHLEAQLSGPGLSEHGMHEETVRVSGVFDLLTPGPQACAGLKPVAVAPDLFALKTSRSGLTTVAGFVGTDHVCSITYFPRHNILVDVDLRGSLSNKTLYAALFFLNAVGIAARGSISSGSLELVLNWRHYHNEIADRRVCASVFECPYEFADWCAQQISRRQSAAPSLKHSHS